MEVKEVTPPPNPKAVAVKAFLDRYFTTPWEKRKSYGLDLDISAPRQKDMKNVGTGEYEISRFNTVPQKDQPGRESYHFYIGTTEFHVTGKAAEEVGRIQEELQKQTLQSK